MAAGGRKGSGGKPALTPEFVRMVAMRLVEDNGHTTFHELGKELVRRGYRVMNGYLPSALAKKGSGFITDENRVFIREDVAIKHRSKTNGASRIQPDPRR